MITLIALRLGIGWHFFKEGAKKFQGDSFTSVYFLQTAKGPLAEFYKSMIPDRQGYERLDQGKTEEFWQGYVANVSNHYNFDESQLKKADAELKRSRKLLDSFHAMNEPEIAEYLLECQRLQDAKADKMSDVAFQRDWIASKEAELNGTLRPWTSAIHLMGQQLQENLRKIATEEQRQAGVYPIPDRTEMFVDTLVKFVVIGVGILLVLGLFTRFAAVMGMGFLLSVMSTQPPWSAGANTDYFYYQLVEVLALLVLVGFAAGRFAGLDYLIYGMRMRCCPPKTIET